VAHMTDRYDVIIVGSGAGGGTLADALAPTRKWYDSAGKPFAPQVHYDVGGATKMYGAALYWLRPADFGEISHSDGISPAWPLSYDDLGPFYTRAEWLYQVHGDHSEDHTEGKASRQYPWPPVSREPRDGDSCLTNEHEHGAGLVGPILAAAR
jgi:choline dehydrogenase-like flavoprotein